MKKKADKCLKICTHTICKEHLMTGDIKALYIILL